MSTSKSICLRAVVIMLIASPLIAILMSQPLISFLAPNDPVPQGAMVVAFLLVMISLIIFLPLGIILIILSRLQKRNSDFVTSHKISTEDKELMQQYLAEDLARKHFNPVDKIQGFMIWKDRNPNTSLNPISGSSIKLPEKD